MQNTIKKLLTLICVIVIPVIIFAYFIITNGTENFYYSIIKLNPWWIVGSFVLMIAYWTFDCLISKYFCQFLGQKISFWKAFENTMVGQFFNAITPFAMGGQPMQTYHLVTSTKITAGTATSVIILKFIVFQTVLIIYSAAVLLLKLNFFLEKIPHILIFSVVGFSLNTIIIAVCFIFCYNKNLGEKIVTFFVKLLQRLRFVKKTDQLHKRIDDELDLFYSCYILVKSKFHIWIITGLLTFVQLTCFYAVTYLLYRGFNSYAHISNSFMTIISAQAFVQMVISIIPIPGGSGGAEGTFYIFFKMFFSPENIALAVFLWRIVTFYTCLGLGGIVIAIPILRRKN